MVWQIFVQESSALVVRSASKPICGNWVSEIELYNKEVWLYIQSNLVDSNLHNSNVLITRKDTHFLAHSYKVPIKINLYISNIF